MQNVLQYIPRLRWAEKLANRLGFNSTNEAEILTFLETVNPEDIVREQLRILPEGSEWTQGLVTAFGPTEEPYITEGVFLHGALTDLLQNAWGNQINLILGGTSMEVAPIAASIQSNPEFLPLFMNYEDYIPRQYNVERNTNTSREYGEMIRKVYYPYLEPTVTNADGLVLVSLRLDLFEIYWKYQFQTIFCSFFPIWIYGLESNNQSDTDFNPELMLPLTFTVSTP